MPLILFFIGLIIVVNIISKLSKKKSYQKLPEKDINLNTFKTKTKPKVFRRYNIELPEDFELSEEFQQAFNLMQQ